VIPLPVLVPLLSMILSTLMAAAIVGRDPGLRIHRLIAMLLGATTWWSLCEVLWQLQDRPEDAYFFLRLSSLGWMALGPVCLHIFAEMAGRPRALIRIALPIAYGCALMGVGIYWSTPAVSAMVPAGRFGWGYEVGSVFFVPYSITVTPPAVVLMLWSRVYPSAAALGGEGLVSRSMKASVIFALSVTFVTEVGLPYLGIQWLHLGTASITLVAIVTAVQLNRFGFSLLSPAAFAREILATLGDGVALLYADGRIRFANRALAQQSGVSAQQLQGRPIEELIPGVLEAAGATPAELDLVTEDGAPLPVLVTAVPLGREGATSLVIRDLREIRSLRERVVTAGRLSTVGELSGVIAREILSPAEQVAEELQSLRHRFEEACKRARDAESPELLSEVLADSDDLIDECIEGIGRVAGIARAVSHFEGEDGRVVELHDPNAVVQSAVRVAAARWPSVVLLERRLGEVPLVRCAATEIGQVVLNLLMNAVDAVESGGRVCVSTGCTSEEVWIEVVDDGPGIAPEIRERIFDPFFTTKPVGKGTGLGLPISFHILERHGGELRCLSEPGGGARFQVRLPLD